MAANTNPIFSLLGDVQWVESVVTANNTIDLTTGTSYLVWTADATNGGFLDHARIHQNPSATPAQTALRLWINNGSTISTSSNSALLGEITLPGITASATAAMPDIIYPVSFAFPVGYKLYATIGTAPGGSAEWTITGVGGKY